MEETYESYEANSTRQLTGQEEGKIEKQASPSLLKELVEIGKQVNARPPIHTLAAKRARRCIKQKDGTQTTTMEETYESYEVMFTKQSTGQEEGEEEGKIEKQASPTPSLLKELVEIAWSIMKWYGIALVVFIFAVLYLIFSSYLSPTTTLSSEISIVDQFTSRIKELKSEMVNQDEKLWRVVRSMKHHINDSNPRQPAVLMLVSTRKASENREYLAGGIAEAYSARCSNADYAMVNGADYTNMNDDDAKLKVNEKILEKFSNGSCAAIISNFGKLPPASTIIFYQFCENDNALYKDVIVIFTLEIEDGPWDEDDYISAGDESTPNSKNWNEIVDQHLHYSLKTRDKTETMNVDMISPLLARIMPAVAWVSSELLQLN